MARSATPSDHRLFAGEEALALTRRTLVFDGLALGYVLEERYAERCLEAGVNAAIVTFVTDASWERTLEGMEAALRRIECSALLRLALGADDVEAARREGRLAVVLGTQGAAFVEDRLWRVGTMWRLGLRVIGLAYTAGNLLADGCGESRDGGLTFLGRDFVAAVNELPLLLDVSHAGHRARAEVAALARAPVCTHSNAFAVHPNARNTTDETALAIAAKGGVLGVCGLPKAVAERDPTLNDLLDHCTHWIRLLGVEHVGLGLDFTEAYQERGELLDASRIWRTRRPDIFGTVDEFLTQSYPRGVESIRQLANLTQGLLDRGYDEAEISAILGGSWLRLLRDAIG